MMLDAHVNAPEKPFFMYYAPGAAHAPHHVPKEWADRYKGTFDGGWDAYRETVFAQPEGDRAARRPTRELSPRDPDVPEWSSLSADERRLYARMMEVFAGLRLARRPPLRPHPRHARADRRARQHADHGHLRQRRLGRGRRRPARSTRCASSTRCRRASRTTWRTSTTSAARRPTTTTRGAGRGPATRRSGAGSARPTAAASTDPFVLAWPAGIAARGEIRTQYAHAIDMVPTVLDALGVEPPETIRGVTQTPLEGVSFAHTFDDAGRAVRATSRSTSRCSATARSTTTAGARCARGRRRTSPRRRKLGRKLGDPITPEVLERARPRAAGSSTTWPTTRPRPSNVAAEHPDVLRELVARWWEEAEKYKVLPLDGVAAGAARRPSARRRRKPRTRFVYYPDGSVVPAFAAPPVYNRAVLDRGRRRDPRRRRRGRARGPGRRRRRLHLLREGRPAPLRLQLRRPRPLRGAGRATAARRGPARAALRVRADRRAGHRRAARARPGRGQLYIDGKLVGATRVPAHDAAALRARGAELRLSTSAPPRPRYEPPFPFTGTIRQVTVDLAGELIADDEADLTRMMAQQ